MKARLLTLGSGIVVLAAVLLPVGCGGEDYSSPDADRSVDDARELVGQCKAEEERLYVDVVDLNLHRARLVFIPRPNWQAMIPRYQNLLQELEDYHDTCVEILRLVDKPECNDASFICGRDRTLDNDGDVWGIMNYLRSAIRGYE